MSRGWVVVLLLVACGGTQAGGEPRVVQIPPSTDPATTDETPPDRGAALPPAPTEDPLPYFVGRWDGLVNEKLKTELIVDSGGGFHVHLAPQPHRPACDLSGKLRVDERTLILDIESSSCEAEQIGSSLERKIISKRDHEFVVQSQDTTMTIRYSRQRQR